MCGGAREDVARAEKLNQVMQKRKKKQKRVTLQEGEEQFIWLQN